MRRLVLTLSVVLAPSLAHAQAFTPLSSLEGVLAPSASAATRESNLQAGAADSGLGRRAAMAGNVDDADVGNKWLLRVESARGMGAADRAEYFAAKCGCYRFLSGSNPRYDASAPGPGPGSVTDATYTQMFVRGEYALLGRMSVLAEVPFRQFAPQAFAAGSGSYASTSGLSDVRAGFKFDLMHDSNSQMTLQLLGSAPTGDAAKSLGTGHWSVEPTMLYTTSLGERAAIETHIGTNFPINGSRGVPTSNPVSFAGRVMTFGLAPTFDVYASGTTRFTPVVEVDGVRFVDGYSTGDDGPANGITVVNVHVGARFSKGRNSVYAGWGKALTNAVVYQNALRVELRHGL